MKHTRKARGDFWGQSMILEAVLGNCLDLGGGRGIIVIFTNQKLVNFLPFLRIHPSIDDRASKLSL